MNYHALINKIKRTESIIEQKMGEVRRLRVSIADNVKSLNDPCVSCCLKAINEYNEKNPKWYIIPESAQVSIHVMRRTISLYVRLTNFMGDEPDDEEFSFQDEETIRLALRRPINEALEYANIPLGFNKLSVPPRYLPK